MSAKDTVRSNKTAILTTLCGDHRLILNKVYEKELITQREYNNIKSINREDVEGHVDALVDKIMNKGEGTCQKFLNLLQTDEDIKSTYPELKNIQTNTSILPVLCRSKQLVKITARVNNSLQPTQAILSSPETQSSYEGERVYSDSEPNRQPFPLYNQADYYSLTRNPRGVCMVISNEVFLGTGLTRQRGVQEDALHTLFTRLGFTVEIHKDLTAEAMQREIKVLGTRNFMNDDALVVCILSHGEKGIVLGTDEQQVSLQELTRPFKSGQAPTLAEKPKLFFIELSPLTREEEDDRPAAKLPCIQAHFDHFVSGPGTGSLRHCNRQNSLEKDAGHIDETAPWDLLLSTMLDCKPFQNTSTGSIYTQELCRQLTISAESSENDDILTVLTRVNREVSKGEYMSHKQMPEYKCTLTKKLVLKFVQADCDQV